MDDFKTIDWENAKSEKRYTIKEIINEEFTKNDLMHRFDDDPDNAEEDHRNNRYSHRTRELREMFNAFNVLEEIDLLKKQYNNNYSFSRRNADFILRLFDQYNGHFQPLKYGKVFEADAEYLLDVYSGILDIFYDSNADEVLVKTVKVKLWNRLNIPQITTEGMLDSLYARCKEVIKKNLTSSYTRMSGEDLIYWQTAIRHSFYRFLLYWNQVYSNMDDLRTDEISDISIEDANKVSEELMIAERLEFMLSSQIKEAREKDELLQHLMKEQDKLRGEGKRKKPLIRKADDKYRECTHRLTERMREVDIEVIRKYYPTFTPPEGWREYPEIENRMKPTDELLAEAIKDTEEQTKNYLSLNFEEVKTQVEKYCL